MNDKDGRKIPTRELFTRNITELNLEAIADEIVYKHWKSAFTDELSLKAWIYGSLKKVYHHGVAFGTNSAEQGFSEYFAKFQETHNITKSSMIDNPGENFHCPKCHDDLGHFSTPSTINMSIVKCSFCDHECTRKEAGLT